MAKAANKRTRISLNIKVEDFTVENPEDTDIIIAVIGLTGAGKSTFINTLMGKTVAEVGDELCSKTTQVKHYVFPHPQYPDRRILVVDTPGFNDTETSNPDILSRIAVWLAKSYQEGMKLAGLIYLQEITHRRVMGSTKISYEVFEKLCGDDGAKKVVLATTMWDEVQREVGLYREKQLKDNFWSNMFSKGSTVHRVQRTRESVLSIVDSVLSHDHTKPIRIQQEMVTERKQLIHTDAYVHLQALEGRGASVKPSVVTKFWGMLKGTSD